MKIRQAIKILKRSLNHTVKVDTLFRKAIRRYLRWATPMVCQYDNILGEYIWRTQQ